MKDKISTERIRLDQSLNGSIKKINNQLAPTFIVEPIRLRGSSACQDQDYELPGIVADH